MTFRLVLVDDLGRWLAEGWEDCARSRRDHGGGVVSTCVWRSDP